MHRGTYFYEPMKHPHFRRVGGFGGFGATAAQIAAARAKQIETAKAAVKQRAIEEARRKAQSAIDAARAKAIASKEAMTPADDGGTFGKVPTPVVIGGGLLVLILALRARQK